MNPTALSLLKQGGTVVLPNQYALIGDPDTGYIQVRHEVFGDLGVWSLDQKGLDAAFKDISRMERKRGGCPRELPYTRREVIE